MADITTQNTLPDSSNKQDFYDLIENSTVTNIVNADIKSTAAIADTKLAAISTAGKVDGAALTGLANTPSGAGALPAANLPNSIADSHLATISTAGKVSGAALTSLSSTPSGAGVMPIANLASGTPDGTKYIRDDGALATPSLLFKLTETKTISGAATTGAVTIAGNKVYKILLRLQSDGSALSSFGLVLNADSTAGHYNIHSIKAVNATLTSVNNSSSNFIPDGSTNTFAPAGEEGVLEMTLTTDIGTGVARASGTISSGDIGQTDHVWASFTIQYNAAPTSLAFSWTNNATGYMYVWEQTIS